MALDVGVVDPESDGLLPSPRAAFRSDGYYWFLHPLFERLRNSHGKYIDLYGDAEFRKSELPLIERLLNDAESLISSQPPRWEVHVGTQTGPVKRELYAEVDRPSFVHLIAQLRAVLSAAETSGSGIRFIGD